MPNLNYGSFRYKAALPNAFRVANAIVDVDFLTDVFRNSMDLSRLLGNIDLGAINRFDQDYRCRTVTAANKRTLEHGDKSELH